MKCFYVFWVLSLIILPLSITVHADNVQDLMKSAQDNYTAKKYAKALEDIEWAKQEITKLHLQTIKSLLPATIPGYTSTDNANDSALGIHEVSREFTKDSQKIKITVLGGNLGQNAGIGAIMGMAAAMQAMGGDTQSEMVTVKGRKGRFNMDTSDDKHGTLTFALNNNITLMIETWNIQGAGEAKKAAELIDYDAIENAYK